ncbi:hypothetical protein HMI54_012379, partial [Coelomomyces lativittatus]
RLNNLAPDLKVEFILTEILEEGDLSDIVVASKGIFKRRFKKDLEQVLLQDYREGRNQYLSIEVNRSGIYDSLPQGLFHQP